jgi:hypothetical protein
MELMFLLHMSRYELGLIPAELQKPLLHDPFGPGLAAATGIAQSVKPMLATVGSKRVVRNFSPRATSMLS